VATRLSAARNLSSQPGRLTDIGGYRLHLNYRGTGSLPVIMDAAGGVVGAASGGSPSGSASTSSKAKS
jgi:hypothetical protein